MSDSPVSVAVVQLEYDRHQLREERIARVLHYIDGVAADVELVVLPELWADGGFGYDTWEQTAEPLDGPLLTAVAEAAARRQVWLHAGSIIERPDGSANSPLFNTSVVINPAGRRHAVYRKIHRFGFSDGEPRLLAPGTSSVTKPIVTASGGTALVGLSTCYDLRFPELYRVLTDWGTEINLIPAAWPQSRIEHWRILGRARAIENQSFVVQCNLAGEDGDVRLGGGSQIVDPSGAVIASADDSETVLTATLDLAGLRSLRRTFPVLADRRLPAVPEPPAHWQGTRPYTVSRSSRQ
jgi:predicted amidohydrolase